MCCQKHTFLIFLFFLVSHDEIEDDEFIRREENSCSKLIQLYLKVIYVVKFYNMCIFTLRYFYLFNEKICNHPIVSSCIACGNV